MKKHIHTSISMLALCWPALAQAEEPETQVMDEVSVTASRVSTAIKDSPVTIDIIDEEELDVVKFVDFEDELLNRIPGKSMSRNLRIPMGSKNYTVNLIDGMAVGRFGAGQQGFGNDTNGFDIQRVEVLRGPASVLYGSNAIGGVINVITRDAPLEPEHRVWGEIGQFHRTRGGVSSAGTVDGLGYFVDANMLNATGWQNRTQHRRETASAKLIKDIGDDSMLTVRGEYLDVHKENPGSLSQSKWDDDWGQAGVNDAFTNEQMLTASAQYMLAPTDNSELNVNYSIRSHEEFGPPSYSASADYGEDDLLNQNLTATYRYDFDTMRSRIIVGADLQHSAANELSYNGRDATASINSHWDIDALVTSPFTQFEISPLEKLRLTFGARYDRVSYDADDKLGTSDADADFSNITRKVGATWELNTNNNVWVGFGEGFVVPSRTYLFTTTRYTANPNLKPERAENFEAGIRGKLLDRRLQYDVALYHTTVKDFVVIGEDGSQVTNAGEVLFKGLEASAGYQVTDYMQLAGAYTYARNKFITYRDSGTDYSGNDLSSSPKHHFNLRATVMPMEEMDVELEWDKISSYYTHYNNSADPNGKADRPGIFNLRLSYDRGPIEFWAHARNLRNTKYAERISYSTRGAGSRSFTSGEARNMAVGIAYNW